MPGQATLTTTITSVVPRRFVEMAAAAGVDRQLMYDALGVTPEVLADPEARVSIEAQTRLNALAARESGDSGLPIRFAESTRMEDYQVLGFAIMTATDGRECLDRVIRFQALLSSAGRYELGFADDEVTVRWVRDDQPTLGVRLGNECSVCDFLDSFRQVVGARFLPLRASFRHAAPADTSAHRRFFGCDLSWEAAEDGFVIPRSVLEYSPASGNAELSAYFERAAEKMLAELNAADTVTGRVRRQIVRLLANGEPAMQDIAGQLGMSERSLRRHLSSEGTRFRELIDDVRREQAAHLLSHGQGSITEIAFVLGFSDVSAFTRAFKRWHGVNPRSYRQTHS